MKGYAMNTEQLIEEDFAEAAPCSHCAGAGSIVITHTGAACGGDVHADGACRGHCAIPMTDQVQVPCAYCQGSGLL